MSNMSYCRFQNTLNDLRDCQSALEEFIAGDGELSAPELEAAKALVASCFEIAGAIAEGAESTVDEMLDGNTESKINVTLNLSNKR